MKEAMVVKDLELMKMEIKSTYGYSACLSNGSSDLAALKNDAVIVLWNGEYGFDVDVDVSWI